MSYRGVRARRGMAPCGMVVLVVLGFGQSGEAQHPVKPAVDERATPLGPLVTDFRAPGLPPGAVEAATGAPCPRCGVVHDRAEAACVAAYKSINGWLDTPYHDKNLLYGYYDYGWGRGPLITLGSQALVPGFRGYGLLGTPGYGAGQRPISEVDLGIRGGHWYPESRRMWPRWSHQSK